MIRAGKGGTAPNILTVGLLGLPRPGGRLPRCLQMHFWTIMLSKGVHMVLTFFAGVKKIERDPHVRKYVRAGFSMFTAHEIKKPDYSPTNPNHS